MVTMDISDIKRLLDESGKSQRDLASALGLNPSAVTRLLKGERRLRADEIPKLDRFFDTKPPPNVVMRAREADAPRDFGPADLPVYGSAQGGPEGMLISYEPVSWVRRPQILDGVVGAFSFYVVGDSMEPRYFQGEHLLADPSRPPRSHDHVLLILAGSDDGSYSAMVKRLVRMKPNSVTVAQYNPVKEFEIDRALVANVIRIVGNLDP